MPLKKIPSSCSLPPQLAILPQNYLPFIHPSPQPKPTEWVKILIALVILVPTRLFLLGGALIVGWIGGLIAERILHYFPRFPLIRTLALLLIAIGTDPNPHLHHFHS
jgi:hypothetical protein